MVLQIGIEAAFMHLYGTLWSNIGKTIKVETHFMISVNQWFLTGRKSSNFQGIASPYMLYTIENFWMEMCPFQTLRQC